MYKLLVGGIPTSRSYPYTPRLWRAFYIFNSSPSAPTFSSTFFVIICFPLFPTASLYVAVPHQSPLVFHLLPTYYPGAKLRLPGRIPPLTPASLRRSSLLPAPHAWFSFRFLWRWDPPFSVLGLHPGPCQTLGVSPVASPSAPLCSWLSLPKVPLQILASSGPWFLIGWLFVRGRESRVSLLFSVTCPSPCSLLSIHQLHF